MNYTLIAVLISIIIISAVAFEIYQSVMKKISHDRH